jgi:type I thyroxine 5'-deiodinase
MASNIRDKVIYRTPQNFDERTEVASSCVRNLGIKIPAIVDDYEQLTERAYTGWPDRIYLIDREGRIALKTNPGPFGFDPSQLSSHLQHIGASHPAGKTRRVGPCFGCSANCLIFWVSDFWFAARPSAW